MNIYAKNIYEVSENGEKRHVLIIYNISSNHYVGLTVHNSKFKDFLCAKSINRFIDLNELKEYNAKNIKRISIYKRKIPKS